VILLVVWAIGTASCFDKGVTFTYSLLLKDDSGVCTTLEDYGCTPCTHDNSTKYYSCVAQVPDSTYSECIVFLDSSCRIPWDDYSTDDLITCRKAAPCVPGIQTDSVLRMTATAPDPITVTIDDSVVSEMLLSASQVTATAMAYSMSMQSSTSSLDFEMLQANGTFLTSAGECAYGQTCQAGDITFTGELVDFPSALELPSIQVYLSPSSMAVQSRSEDPLLISGLVDVISVELDTVGEFIFFDSGDYGVAVSDLSFEDTDSAHPTLNCIGYANGESVGSQSTTCDVYVTGPLRTISCSLSSIFNKLEGQAQQ
jgi:hypothetical protein